MRSVYFDYNATTPLDPAVREAMLPFLDAVWGNPSSVHHVGRRARALLDDSRERAAALFGASPSEIIFTSGGTESNNLAIFGSARALISKGKHLITSQIEHHAVLDCFAELEKNEGFQVSRLPVDKNGFVSVDDLKKSIRMDTVLVSVMAANNEIGSLQPVAELGAVCRERGIIFHTDAVQWFGKEPVSSFSQFNADLVSVCAHKLHGPKGAGLLYARSPFHPRPLYFGGPHEFEHRAGTENLASIVGLVSSLESFVKVPVFIRSSLDPLVHRLRIGVEILPGCTLVSPVSCCLGNTVSFVVEGVEGISVLAGLDLVGICASSGAACSSGSLVPSHVIRAIGKLNYARSLVRFSLGRDSSLEEVDFVLTVLPGVIRNALLA